MNFIEALKNNPANVEEGVLSGWRDEKCFTCRHIGNDRDSDGRYYCSYRGRWVYGNDTDSCWDG